MPEGWTVLAAYADLKGHIGMVVRQNKYLVVSLNKVLEGLYFVKATGHIGLVSRFERKNEKLP